MSLPVISKNKIDISRVGGQKDVKQHMEASSMKRSSNSPLTLDLYRFVLAESSHSLVVSIICLDLSWQW